MLSKADHRESQQGPYQRNQLRSREPRALSCRHPMQRNTQLHITRMYSPSLFWTSLRCAGSARRAAPAGSGALPGRSPATPPPRAPSTAGTYPLSPQAKRTPPVSLARRQAEAAARLSGGSSSLGRRQAGIPARPSPAAIRAGGRANALSGAATPERRKASSVSGRSLVGDRQPAGSRATRPEEPPTQARMHQRGSSVKVGCLPARFECRSRVIVLQRRCDQARIVVD